MRFRLIIFTFCLILSYLGVRQSYAATASRSFSVSATVQAGCALLALPMNLGSYIGAVPNAAAPVSVDCTHSTPYTVGIIAPAQLGVMRAEWNPSGLGSTSRRYLLSSNLARRANWAQIVGGGSAEKSVNGVAHAPVELGQVSETAVAASGADNDAIIVSVTY